MKEKTLRKIRFNKFLSFFLYKKTADATAINPLKVPKKTFQINILIYQAPPHASLPLL